MQKIGQSTDTANADDEFTEGSAAGGIAATLLRAAWLNTIQRELAAVVEGAGLGLDATNDAQLLAAIQKLSTLPASGAAAGTFTKVTINAKGLVTEGSALTAADVPALPWSKISTGKPTTLAGYGITDALAAAGTAVAAAKLATARTLTFSGGATGTASFDGSANVGIALTLRALVAADIPSLDWSKINSGKPTTLAGYGITDGLSTTGNAASASKWAAPRTLTLSGSASGSVSLDGSANVALDVTIAVATESGPGIVELATPAEVRGGTDPHRAVTPVGLEAARPAAGQCTAWVNFNGMGAVAIRDSYNVSSITDNGVGDYTVNFATPMLNDDYATLVTGTLGDATTQTQSIGYRGNNNTGDADPVLYSTTQVRLLSQSSSGTNVDQGTVSISTFGGK